MLDLDQCSHLAMNITVFTHEISRRVQKTANIKEVTTAIISIHKTLSNPSAVLQSVSSNKPCEANAEAHSLLFVF